MRIAINGYGRIGRSFVRALAEREGAGWQAPFTLAAINDKGRPEDLLYLTRYDTTHGRLAEPAELIEGMLRIGKQAPMLLEQPRPELLPWGELGVDVVLECTGFFATKDKAMAHIEGGAKHVVVSQPAGSDVKTIVYGVNHETLEASDQIVSNASCTTNCLAPVAKALQDTVGIESGLMTTTYAFTNDQVLTDVYHSDLRRARSATHSMIPTKTGAAAAVGLVMPELKGKLDGFALRVPIPTGSITDLTLVSEKKVTVEEINAAYKKAAEGELKGILMYTEDPIVSSDIVGDPHSSIYDSGLVRVIDNTVKLSSWYDNEWGYSNRLVELTALVASKL